MESTFFEAWLRQKGQRDSLLCALGAVGLALLGIALVYFTFWVVYAVVWFGFDWITHLSHSTRLIVSGVVVVALFIGNATTDRRYLDKLDFEMDASAKFVRRAAIVTGYGWLSVMAGPKSMHSFVKVLTSLLFVGPRLFTAAYHFARKLLRIRARDDASISSVLDSLFTAGKRVPFTELVQKHPELDSDATIEDLHDIDGILFLTSEPPGMSIGSELRNELSAWQGNNRAASAPSARRPNAPEQWSS